MQYSVDEHRSLPHAIDVLPLDPPELVVPELVAPLDVVVPELLVVVPELEVAPELLLVVTPELDEVRPLDPPLVVCVLDDCPRLSSPNSPSPPGPPVHATTRPTERNVTPSEMRSVRGRERRKDMVLTPQMLQLIQPA
jgi:hypothetical protein